MARSIVRCLTGLLFFVAILPASAQTVIVDNSDPAFTELGGPWQSTSIAGQYGTDYRYQITGPGNDVRWTATLPTAGPYAVSVWYRNANDRPSNARYTVAHAAGTTDVLVDQRVNGSMWVPLGEFNFASGAATVTLSSDAQVNTTIVADAVRFAYNGPALQVPEVRACWLTQYQYLGKTEAQLRAIAQNIRAGSMNTVYIAMYSGATVYWPSKAYLGAGGSWGSSSVDYADYLTRIFHSEGLKVGAWFEYGFAVGAATHPIAVAHPDWLARDQAGSAVTGENGGFVFLSPGNSAATAVIVEMARELAANYDFDDIQLDRFRWGRKTTGREYGYEASTSSLYQSQYGSPPPTNVNNSQWVTFREGLVNQAVQQAYNAIKAANPNIVVSSAPLGSYGITQNLQRWSAWVNGSYMDLVMPQMYMTSLSSFQTELNTQRTQAPAHWDKLGVGYRASDDNDWALVRDELNYARGLGHLHGCLWVYHQYTAQIAIQDEINNLPTSGQPWAAPAFNPFVSECMEQIFVDNRDGAPAYVETGAWSNSAQPDFFRFDSRVVAGGAANTATFNAAIPKSGAYYVYAWYTTSSNRNGQAQYTIQHLGGSTPVNVDQRVNGGRWTLLGQYYFTAGGLAPRVVLSSAGSTAAEFTSADAIKLVLAGPVLGDSTGDCLVTSNDMAGFVDCMLGPQAGPPSSTCDRHDFDRDGDVDMADLQAIQQAVSP